MGESHFLLGRCWKMAVWSSFGRQSGSVFGALNAWEETTGDLLTVCVSVLARSLSVTCVFHAQTDTHTRCKCHSSCARLRCITVGLCRSVHVGWLLISCKIVVFMSTVRPLASHIHLSLFTCLHLSLLFDCDWFSQRGEHDTFWAFGDTLTYCKMYVCRPESNIRLLSGWYLYPVLPLELILYPLPS